jgi:phosphate-selective porin OprO/OprP
MIPHWRKWIGSGLVCGIALLGLVRCTSAQAKGNPLPGGSTASVPAALGAPEDPDGDLRVRLERLEKQREELLGALRNVTAPVSTDAAPTSPPASKDDVRDFVMSYLAEKDAEKKHAAAANSAASPEGYKVGSILGASASFNEWGELWITTPNKDFTMHSGLFMSYDNVFWDQSPQLVKAPGARPGPKQGVASGVAANGIGDLEDGTYFRRIRPQIEGALWDTFAYRFSLSLENIQYSTVGLDEFWVAANYIPVIGTVRVGHVRNCMGFEGDMSSSSRVGTFLERSSYAEAILLNQNYVTGAWFGNNFLDEHMTYTVTVFRQDQGTFSGAFFGDGQYGAQGRLTCLPLYECEGRHWLHLGVSYGWRNGNNNLATSPDRVFQLRARPEMRDDDPAGSPSGTQLVPDGDSARMVDTGPIAAENDYILGLELCYARGPFSVQTEWGWNFLDGAYGVAPSGFKLNPPIIPHQDYTFFGGYLQLAYTLTGEARGYDRRYGTLSRNYFGEPGVFSNAWLVRDEDGRLNWGLGAWEIAARYSYVNLNDGSGLQRIQGGKMDGLSVNLNWYLNNELKIQFGWAYNHRFEVPEGTFSGYTSGFGTRVQLVF